MTTILKERTVFEDSLVIDKGEIESHGEKFSRARLRREDAVAILLVNTDTGKVILTRQFRYAIADKTQEPILEIVAGKVDDHEEPAQAALREVEEETGYRIQEHHLKFLFSCFASPGYSSERFLLYYAQVTDPDKISQGGGLLSEHEHIELVEMDIAEFNENIKKAQFKDAKTYIAGLFLALHNVIP